jgi:hypothetical protein
MEDLKKYLGIVAKHSFWIITVLVIILSSVIFYLTKTSLDESITTRISALNASFNKINEVNGKVSTHPNDHSHKEMDQRLTRLKEDVDRAWEFQYERQKELLTWPIEAFWEPKTHEIFDNLRPFEKKVPFPLPDKIPPPLDQITQNDLRVYRDYIAPEFPALARRIGSTWKYTLDAKTMASGPPGYGPPGAAGTGLSLGTGGSNPPGYPGFGATAVTRESRDLVRWSEDSQKTLTAAVLPWFARPTPPTIHEVYYAQEDIWILRGLMDIIAQTNAGAQENFQAIVKEIEWIRTGAKASRDAGSLWDSGAQMGAGGAPYAGGGPPAGYGGGAGSSMPAGYGAAGGMGGKGGEAMAASRAAVRVDPADGRYVDTNFKPLTGAQLRSAMNLVSATDAVNAVAKRVPVRMRLKVDDRFGRLITECGNGKMMLEVLQVRYNTDPAPDVGGAGGGSGSGMGPPGGGAGLSFGASATGAGASMQTEGDSGPSTASVLAAEVAGDEISIEVFGLIYLFNPPANLSGTNAAVTPAAPATSVAAPATSAAAPAQVVPSASTSNPTVAADTPPAAASEAAPTTNPTDPATTSEDSATPPVATDSPPPNEGPPSGTGDSDQPPAVPPPAPSDPNDGNN